MEETLVSARRLVELLQEAALMSEEDAEAGEMSLLLEDSLAIARLLLIYLEAAGVTEEGG